MASRSVRPGNAYCYVVVAVDAAGKRSLPSPQACASTPDLVRPTTPSGLSVVAKSDRAVAISYRDSPEAAIPLVEAVYDAKDLPHSHVVAAVLANLHARAGSTGRAQPLLDEALRRARTAHEKELIARQIDLGFRFRSPASGSE